jgi:hypothetical protein
MRKAGGALRNDQRTHDHMVSRACTGQARPRRSHEDRQSCVDRLMNYDFDVFSEYSRLWNVHRQLNRATSVAAEFSRRGQIHLG